MIAESFFLLVLAGASIPHPEEAAPASEPALLARIEGLLASGRASEARRAADEALRAFPSSRPLRMVKARALLESGDYPSCEALLDELLLDLPRTSPERPRLLLRLGEAHLLQGDLEGAAGAAEEAIAAHPGDELAAAAGGIFLRARRYRRALHLLDRAVARAPGDRFLLYGRGVARSRTGAFQEACRDLEAAAVDPSLRVEARYELGMALGNLGEPSRAVAELLAALAEDPWRAPACHLLGQELIRLKKARLAGHLQRYFHAQKEAEGLSSRDHHLAALGRPIEAGIERVRRWERLGRYEKALEELELLRRRGGGAAAAREEAEFWLRGGLPAEARRALESSGVAGDPALAGTEARIEAALPGGSPPPSLLVMAREALERGAGGEAYRRARLLLALEPRSEEALRLLVEMHRDPSEVLPRIHFLGRLLEVRPSDRETRAALDEARGLFE